MCTVAGWIFDIAEALGIKTEAANPMHDAWRWKNVKKKTDKEDALKLVVRCWAMLRDEQDWNDNIKKNVA